MDPLSAVIAFSIAAALLTITPGLDTALVLRTAAVDGGRHAMQAGAGVVAGVLGWGLLASAGLGAVLTLSETGYRIVQYLGAGYIIWLGSRMLLAAVRGSTKDGAMPAGEPAERSAAPAVNWFWRGLMTNLLNPKVGVFYVSFLPQFIPPDVPVVAFGIALAAIHAVMGLVWFAAITAATRPFTRLFRRRLFTRGIDGMTGSVLIAFGLRLAFEKRS
ncbi:LysE family translocator [Hoeflea olei]|uniref:Threonine transporter RhtB n=1 Tax=Hoeflea olei TaxID=1480615 RepID=A0A1C1Z1E7_9HYPH|nr:LysE family translocator [Hoeflea olei]OCW59555.1 threonine transporter RhtB [Hoeflea olei]